MLSIPCKTGSIQVTDDGIIRVARVFGKVLWQAPVDSVTGFTVQPGGMVAVTVTIHTNGHGNYLAETVTKGNFAKLQSAFPNLQAQSTGNQWYHSPVALTHVATYDNQKQMQREMEAAYQHGWVIQGQSAESGKSSAAKVIGGALLAGPVGALAGAVSKSKGKITVTYVRSPEWLASQKGS